MRISTLAATVALSALMATGAVAADVYTGDKSLKDDANYVQGTVVNWSGLYVGGQIGYGHATFGIDEYSGGLGLEGFAGGGKIGYDFAIGRFVIGPFAEYNWSDINFFDAISIDNEWTVGGRAGVVVAPRTLVYGLVGWTQAELVSGGGSETFDGIKAGGGVEFAISGNLFANLEVTHSWYDLDDAFDPVTFEDTRAMVGLKLKLNRNLLNY